MEDVLTRGTELSGLRMVPQRCRILSRRAEKVAKVTMVHLCPAHAINAHESSALCWSRI